MKKAFSKESVSIKLRSLFTQNAIARYRDNYTVLNLGDLLKNREKKRKLSQRKLKRKQAEIFFFCNLVRYSIYLKVNVSVTAVVNFLRTAHRTQTYSERQNLVDCIYELRNQKGNTFPPFCQTTSTSIKTGRYSNIIRE